ncbi:MAG: hypothetical protein MPI95_06075 [Nitrosopumilus sp.]|nr:hypothetical protein [Nitrosopumilus sp.]CAI9832508.1 conserved membrane hypothetical protein [Nitrosopumilaceae archaeon]MDA7941500.1 hypothetical protein [Nitrosopumilus sp.]MDA7943358.1 hypothetical protein [Nitrosopumilus sp.]MDA7944807.1 hypothetical protein [Nitrosopumilus sp.]
MGPASRGAAAACATAAAYLGIVIATTPALGPLDAAAAALGANWPLMAGTGAAVGIQFYSSSRARAAGCSTRLGAGGNTGGAAAASFFSFFSLVPLGCCGWWLYALSLLPGLLGAGASAALIEYSVPLAYGAMAVALGMAGASLWRLRTRVPA